ncbi:hypothetical protein Gotur_028498 [Gossypium turneri]
MARHDKKLNKCPESPTVQSSYTSKGKKLSKCPESPAKAPVVPCFPKGATRPGNEEDQIGDRGGTNRSDKGLNLSGSWQQGHSATYNTPSRVRELFAATAAPTTRALGGQRPLLRVGNRATGACITSSLDFDLEAFSHNSAHGSFAPLAFQPSAMTNCANQRFLSY